MFVAFVRTRLVSKALSNAKNSKHVSQTFLRASSVLTKRSHMVLGRLRRMRLGSGAQSSLLYYHHQTRDHQVLQPGRLLSPAKYSFLSLFSSNTGIATLGRAVEGDPADARLFVLLICAPIHQKIFSAKIPIHPEARRQQERNKQQRQPPSCYCPPPAAPPDSSVCNV